MQQLRIQQDGTILTFNKIAPRQYKHPQHKKKINKTQKRIKEARKNYYKTTTGLLKLQAQNLQVGVKYDQF